MTADYYTATTENGDHIDDPSEDALFDLIYDLNDSDNTFVTVEPVADGSAWYATVGVLDSGGYEIVTRDASLNEHEITTSKNRNRIALDLTIWLAGRRYPGMPDQNLDR